MRSEPRDVAGLVLVPRGHRLAPIHRGVSTPRAFCLVRSWQAPRHSQLPPEKEPNGVAGPVGNREPHRIAKVSWQVQLDDLVHAHVGRTDTRFLIPFGGPIREASNILDQHAAVQVEERKD